MEEGQIRALMGVAKQAARQAGTAIMTHYGNEYKIYSKGIDSHTGDIVTQADHEAQDIIMSHLNHPDHRALMEGVAILAEEMDDHHRSDRFEQPYLFLIDPLDGTRGFVDRNNSFAVSIGLVQQDGTPVFGIAYLPAMDTFIAAIHEHETLVNGRVKDCTHADFDQLTLWLSEAEFFAADRNRVWHDICHALKSSHNTRKINTLVVGSPVHKGCNVVTHAQPSLYLGLPRARKGVSLWDLGAIASIVSGAGGWVSDIHGQPLELNRRQSTYVHHQGFVFASDPSLAESAIRCFTDTYGDRLF